MFESLYSLEEDFFLVSAMMKHTTHYSLQCAQTTCFGLS